jgi:plastocyanin
MRKLLLSAVVLVILAVTASTAAARPVLKATLNDNAEGENYFKPSKKTIRPYTLVKWTWKGSSLHDVTLYSAPKAIAQEDYAYYSSTVRSEGTFKRRLKRSGVWKFQCTIHADMRQRLTVKKG